MDYTDEMLRCLRKLSERRLEEVMNEWKNEFADTIVWQYLSRLMDRVKREDT